MCEHLRCGLELLRQVRPGQGHIDLRLVKPPVRARKSELKCTNQRNLFNLRFGASLACETRTPSPSHLLAHLVYRKSLGSLPLGFCSCPAQMPGSRALMNCTTAHHNSRSSMPNSQTWSAVLSTCAHCPQQPSAPASRCPTIVERSLTSRTTHSFSVLEVHVFSTWVWVLSKCTRAAMCHVKTCADLRLPCHRCMALPRCVAGKAGFSLEKGSGVYHITSSKDAIRWRPSQVGWRPSQVGWRPSLLATRSY